MEKPNVELFFILDRSGSMSGLEEDTLGGYNRFLKEQAKTHSLSVTTVLFDHQVEVVRKQVPAEEALLREGEYFVRGSTALLDAIGWTVNHCIDQRVKAEENPKTTIFVITTDGMENASVHYDYRAINQLISHCQEKLGFQFVFLAANIDAFAEGRKMGVKESHIQPYEATREGTKTMFKNACCMTADIIEKNK